MIRVIYRWRVSPENFEAFKTLWRETTNHIHNTVPGAMGSFMLKARQGESELLTVARWDSFESWQAIFSNANPQQMVAMRKHGERLSVEAYDEIMEPPENDWLAGFGSFASWYSNFNMSQIL